MPIIDQLLAEKILKFGPLIEDWLKAKFKKNQPLFYNSIDLRHSGFKIAPIDTNCFPSGFNNLAPASLAKAKQAATDYLSSYYPNSKKILIIAEGHTRNVNYLENLQALIEIIKGDKEEREVLLGSLVPGEEGAAAWLLKKEGKIITKQGLIPDLIILNNDLTTGLDPLLKGISQPIVPATSLGWYQRKKSSHFTAYYNLVLELCSLIDLDPWLISALHHHCQGINFKESKGLECLVREVENLLGKIRQKYQQYEVDSQPYCYIKADNGTYGRGVMTVTSPHDLYEINKKQRNKMGIIKGNTPNTQVIIQEGIITADRINNIVAEPLIYLVNGQVVGNLFRLNSKRSENNNLNAEGMSFADLEELQERQLLIGGTKGAMMQIYSLIARLAALAAAKENYESIE